MNAIEINRATPRHPLDDVEATVRKFVALPSDHHYVAVALWIAASHAIGAWQHATRLCVTSPEKRCGKSRLLDLVEGMCRNPLMTVNATVAAVTRSIAEDTPTLLIDEADTLFSTKRAADNNEELRGVLNAGWQRNRPSIRWDVTTRSLERIDTFAMAALAAIGRLPDTVMDRSVVVRMRRRAPGEPVSSFRERRDRPALNELRAALADWITPNVEPLADAQPDMSPLEDRAADVWESLAAVADLAGGHWPAKARRAMVALTDHADDDANLGTELLRDVRRVFSETRTTAIPTAELLDRLKGLDESPWRAFDTTARDLARRLKAYDVRPEQVRAGDRQSRGYKIDSLIDAFTRYLPDEDARPHVSQPVTASHHEGIVESHPSHVTDEVSHVTDAVAPIHAPCDGVTGGDTGPVGAGPYLDGLEP